MTNIGRCSTDYFQGTNAKTGTNLAGARTTPRICGVNTGSHMYVEAGLGLADQPRLDAVLTGASARLWKVCLWADGNFFQLFLVVAWSSSYHVVIQNQPLVSIPNNV